MYIRKMYYLSSDKGERSFPCEEVSKNTTKMILKMWVKAVFWVSLGMIGSIKIACSLQQNYKYMGWEDTMRLAQCQCESSCMDMFCCYKLSSHWHCPIHIAFYPRDIWELNLRNNPVNWWSWSVPHCRMRTSLWCLWCNFHKREDHISETPE